MTNQNQKTVWTADEIQDFENFIRKIEAVQNAAEKMLHETKQTVSNCCSEGINFDRCEGCSEFCETTKTDA